ncbi:NUDIX hydrolase [Ramlibacter sp.]|uniref:NUDIX domain-containing protein n=1 Tax=Ramlibacter sp. TaxID=1917967 RepID=UPI0017DD8840|nr:NUDIX hydrolase [Ramlibacter sp.]MBA2672354.1 NUDIX hydrolase [Ramlibacter sp.]
MTTPRDDDAHLVEHTVDSRQVFQGSFLRVMRDTVRLPDGNTAQREYIQHPGAVVVVPLLDDGRMVMERQYRYPVRQVMVEFPAGKLDVGEDPLVCGKRELLEETGYTAREWARAGVMHLAVGYCDESIHIWFARGLVLTRPQLDEGEFVEVITATPDAFLAWCRDGRVTDAKTLATVAWVQNTLSGAWKLDWRS